MVSTDFVQTGSRKTDSTKERNAKMDIKTDLPFDFCEKCIQQELDLHHEEVYAYDEIVSRYVCAYCRNSSLCKYIVSKLQNNEIKIKKEE